MDLNQLRTNSLVRHKVLLYGPPKSGKTALAGELANHGYKLHWCDLENGIATLFNTRWVSEANRSNINYIRIPDYREYPIAIDTVRTILKGGKTEICHAHGAVNCVKCKANKDALWSTVDLTTFGENDILVIDSLTQLGLSAINKILKAQIEKQGDNLEIEWNDWRRQGFTLDTILTRLQAAPINAIVISHETDVEKDEKKVKMAPVSGTRNYSTSVGKYFDELIYTTVLNGKHRIANSTTYSNTVQSGGRSGIILDKLEVPSLLPIFRPSEFDACAARKA